MKYGKHTDLVEAFLTRLKSGDVDWEAARNAARNVAQDAARDACWATARRAALGSASGAVLDAASGAVSDAWAAVGSARAAAGYAAYEIIGHEFLAEQAKALVFLPMFGIESIEKLKEMVK